MKVLRALRRRLSQRLGDTARPVASSAFGHAGVAGRIDRIEGAPLPLVRVFGHYPGQATPPFRLDTDRRSNLPPQVHSRLLAAGAAAAPSAFTDFRCEFLLEPGERPQALHLEGQVLHAFAADAGFATLEPHYRHFFSQDQVMGRGSVYGSGPPTDVSPEFKAFTLLAQGRVLDFGCGNGDVVGHLRGQGRDATGLELDEPRIRKALKPEAAAHVQLYPGGTPLPLESGAFDWIVSTEVIEHIPDIARYVPEWRRVLRPGGRALVTTPDITSIPSSFPAGCVPWHLLESTHLNFFTPASVATLFGAHFTLESTYCLGATRINGFYVPGSIGAVLRARN